VIELSGIGKSYGAAKVIDDLSVRFEGGALTVLVGPSGCGKSTLLRMINRLIVPDTGSVRIDGQDIAALDPQVLRRGIGYVIQAGGLFPHWDVARNIATVPRLLGWPEQRIQARVADLLTMFDLSPADYAHKRPRELSGGQQQRVGVARALAADPKLLLMDEPFAALDPPTRRELQIGLRKIQRDTGKTILFVTHDMDETLLLADRIAVMNRGRIVQYGTPAEIVEQPASDFVRAFVGGGPGDMRGLMVRQVRDIMRDGGAGGAPSIAADASLREALALMLASHVESLNVSGQDRHVTVRDILA
jgi:osmoprotectant transport system ATP-binding protein